MRGVFFFFFCPIASPPGHSLPRTKPAAAIAAVPLRRPVRGSGITSMPSSIKASRVFRRCDTANIAGGRFVVVNAPRFFGKAIAHVLGLLQYLAQTAAPALDRGRIGRAPALRLRPGAKERLSLRADDKR